MKIAAAEQRAPQQILSRAARSRNQLINGSFITPNKLKSLIHHTAKKINVFSRRVELGLECNFNRRHNIFPEQDIARSRLGPIHFVSRWMGGPVEELPFNNPGWRRAFKMWFH